MADFDFSKLLPDLSTLRPRAEVDADIAARAEADRLAEAAKRARVIYDQCIPVGLKARAWDAKPTQPVKAVQAWLDSSERGLVLRGPVGAGKSTAACVAVRRWAEMGKRTSWLTPRGLVSAVLHDYDPNAPKIYDCVVLDDLGVGDGGDLDEALARFLDDERAERFLITTNLKRDDMRSRYDVRVIDRLRDSCQAIDVKGASMRRKSEDF